MPTHTITIDGFGPFEAQEGQKLVLAIEGAGYDISHRCGGQAKCTTCRIRILEGDDPPMGQVEHDSLEEDGVLGQFRLSCQIRVDRPLTIKPLMRASEQGWDPGIEVEP